MTNLANSLFRLRHSCAHLLAAAIVELYPGAKPTIGPVIEDGFYYDFDLPQSISKDDLPKIEEKMRQIVKSWSKITGRKVQAKEAKLIFADNPYKIELINELIDQKQPIMVYKSDKFEDLCKGNHIDNPADIKFFKLLSVAGAYWRGDEKNKMLTRIYGTCFPNQKELDQYLKMIEEAKKRDHRKLGEVLEIFTIKEEIGPGLILWLPKGNIIKEELEKWAKETEQKWGYQRVTTPHITKAGLFRTSGHLPYYQKDMYPPMKLENDEYYLKPMNCPFHHLIFASKTRSYRELPLRLAEYGTCYRYEASGELFGLMRVRGFTQNDSHIYCTLEQAVEEFVQIMKLHEYYYQTLGISKYHLELALRDPKKNDKYHGDDQMWKLAEKLMREAVKKTNIKMEIEEGSAAFYGPKIDFVVTSSIGRQFAVSTNQIDLYMGKKFNLKYIDQKGQEQTPVIIHRAPLGSHERFIGFLLEHFDGNFPLWLAPIQVQILPITKKNLEWGQKVLEQFLSSNIRAEIDERDRTLSARIRDAQLQKIPLMVIIGEQEDKEKKITVRTREGKDLGICDLDHFIKEIAQKIANKDLS